MLKRIVLAMVGHLQTVVEQIEHVDEADQKGQLHPLSNLSYTLLFLYLLLHLVGVRHLYSSVPYDDWTDQLFGVRVTDIFGFQRNHYDRLVHLCFGLLLLGPAREVVVRLMKIRGGWSLVIAVWLLIVIGTVYELLEWVVAMVMEPDATERYNGQQGDMWDTHRDMALAMGGAVFSAVFLALISWLRGQRVHRTSARTSIISN